MKKDNSQGFYEKTGMIKCLEKELAFCTSECPFHFNVPEFMNKIQRGSFDTAFKDFKNAVGFPKIALELCDERCKNVCPRKDKDVPVQIKLLEEASMQYAKNTDPTEFNIPYKDKKIAIIGAGICGMACALRLCEKKYRVDIYEKTDRIGGRLWEVMNSAVFLEDLNKQFMFEEYKLYLNSEIKSIGFISNQYDAVFIATGKGGFKAEGKGIFIGGAMLGMNYLDSLANGLGAAKQIEAYVKTGIMNQQTNQYFTRMPLPDLEDVEICSSAMNDPLGFSEEEAKLEARRCLRCECSACRKQCDLLLFYKKSPLKTMEEVRATTEVRGVLAENMTIATKMIASCNQCGLCAEVCPENIDFKSIMLEARRTLHKRGSLPWAFNDFFLKDMAFANNKADVTINPIFSSNPKFIFFPGCQLGASDPRYVQNTYHMLLEYYPDTVLINQCCGAPAVWAGNEELQDQVFDKLRKQWKEYDKPDVLFACPTCKQILEEYLPEIQGKFIYKLLDELDVEIKSKKLGLPASVFDPCSARNDMGVQSAVRALAKKADYSLTPLKYEGIMAKCCGFGGNSRVVNPKKAADTAERRIAQGKDMYITYCVNCRDIFAECGKETIHILDAVLDINDGKRPAPTITQRRRNRELLKAELLEEFCGAVDRIHEENKLNVMINDELKQKLNRKLIYETEVIEVIAYCETNRRKVRYAEKDTFFGYKEIGKVTVWVEYRYIDEGIELVDAYSHRISIMG